MELKRPKWYPHRPCKAYTLQGFERRVVPRLMRELNISKKEAEKLNRLYFPRGFMSHLDKTGAYRNTRQYRLYRLGRKLGKDRKSRLFDLVQRSEMFYVYYDDDGQVVAFVSPWVHAALGIIPFEQLAQL
jgi:hypothetical protein